MQELKPHERSMGTGALLQEKSVQWAADAERDSARADGLEEQARELDRGSTGMGDHLRAQAGAHREAATRHRERAEMAKRGRYLVHPDDMDWQLKNHELHSRCIADGRQVYPAGTTRID